MCGRSQVKSFRPALNPLVEHNDVTSGSCECNSGKGRWPAFFNFSFLKQRMNFYMHRSEVKIKPLYFSPVLGTSEAKQLHVTRHMERQGVGDVFVSDS